MTFRQTTAETSKTERKSSQAAKEIEVAKSPTDHKATKTRLYPSS